MNNRQLEFYKSLIALRNDLKTASMQELHATLSLLQEFYSNFVSSGTKYIIDEYTNALIVITIDQITRLVATKIDSVNLTNKYCEISDMSFNKWKEDLSNTNIQLIEPSNDPEEPLELESQSILDSSGILVPENIEDLFPTVLQSSYLVDSVVDPPIFKTKKKQRFLKKPSKFKSRVNFSDQVLDYLYDWINENTAYPNKREKEELAKTCGMTFTQVNNWFINTRRRKMKLE
ncbi:hypothetical protein HDV04_000197 [Boothiomyces sp. JEL0838]|nr:hypothetical protein HDV04_000197 [Boothiomyces sp. JEL0838]